MKTLGAGKLISKEHTPFEKPLSVAQCIHYALTRPAVASTLIGCQTGGEVKEAVRYLDLSDEERDYTPCWAHCATILKATAFIAATASPALPASILLP